MVVGLQEDADGGLDFVVQLQGSKDPAYLYQEVAHGLKRELVVLAESFRCSVANMASARLELVGHHNFTEDPDYGVPKASEECPRSTQYYAQSRRERRLDHPK